MRVACPKVAHLIGVSGKIKQLVWAFTEIHRKTPILVNNRVHTRARAEGFLRTLSFILDMRCIATRASDDWQNNALHTDRWLDLGVFQNGGSNVERLGLETTAARLRGDVGTQVLLTVQPPNGETEELSLERRNVDLRPVRTRRLRSDTHTLGHLRITQFSEGVPKQVQEALQELTDKGVEGVVLDLRNNSGGLVSGGLAVADAFLDQDPIVETRNRDGIADPIQSNPTTLYDGPMVTLVNAGTASASEILAGALQDNDRSLLLGSETFGKGLIQTLTNLSDGSGLAVTVAGYVTPSGRDIQGQGITPDRLLDQPEPLNPGGEGDRWLTDAARVLEAIIDRKTAESLPTADAINSEEMAETA